MPTAPPQISGVHSSKWTQIGGENRISTNPASPTTIRPRNRITNTAGPSPASCVDRSRPQIAHVGRTRNRPVKSGPSPQRGQRQPSAARATETAGNLSARLSSVLIDRAPPRSAGSPFVSAAAPPIDADEQEQPDDVDEMPIPSCRLEAEMVVRLEMPEPCPGQADDQKGRADDDVEAVKARRHEEGGRKDAAGKMEGGVAVLVGLDRGEAQTEEDGQRQAAQHAVAVV